jgi:NTE family protein
MASMALPPWLAPIEKDGHVIMDAGALGNLPIPPARARGATKIIAFDLDDLRPMLGNDHAFDQILGKLLFALSQRHIWLEAALADATGVPIRRIELQSPEAWPIWDFSRSGALSEIGYEIASQEISRRNRTESAGPARPASPSAE